MMLEGLNGCCGVREIDGLAFYDGKPEEAMKVVAKNTVYDHTWRHALFTQAGKGKRYGTNFATYITKHKLGTVVATPTKVNPNSGNPLKAFIWTINWPAFKKWADTHGVNLEDEDEGW
jgi:hypothetical protein